MSRARPSLVAAAVVAGLAAGTLLTGSLTGARPPAGAEQPRRVAVQPVTDAVLVCPTVTVDRVTSSVVAAGAPTAGGSITVSALTTPPGAAPLTSVTGRAELRFAPVGPRSGPLVVHATGAPAAGLTAMVLTRGAGRSRSLQTIPCTQPAGETWLVGGSTVSGRRDVVYLTNADSAPAIVDVSVYGTSGVAQPGTSQGLTVPARSQTSLALDALAPGLATTAVHVVARSGRVAAALLDTAANGRLPQGVDWVPPAVTATHLLVGGIPVEPDGRHLLVLAAPGGSDAQVRVRLVTPAGTLSPGPLQAITVPAGRVAVVDLGGAGPFPPPYDIRVDSDQPVAAGVWTVRGSAPQLPEMAWAGATAPVTGPGVVVPWVTRTAVARTSLELTAGGSTDIPVRLSWLDATGTAVSTAVVTAGADRIVVVPVPSGTHPVNGVLVAGQGPVFVSWAVTETTAQGPLITGGWPAQSGLTQDLPAVVADPAVGYPGH